MTIENQNSVCYASYVTEIKEIPGADNIELVVVGGWNAITKKGEYNEGDGVIIATTDAIIPQDLSDKMGVTNYLRKGQRVRTVRLRGVYSECLIIPMSFLDGKGAKNLPGTDLMGTLGIFKYEPPTKQIQLASGKKIKYKDNPNFHVYYKFPNLKNVSGMFTEDDVVEITRKIHGTNARYGIVKKTSLSFMDKVKKFFHLGGEWIDYEYVYGSHNVEKGSDSQGFYSTDIWRTIADKYQIKEKLWKLVKEEYTPKELGAGVVLYGEIYGAGIQKNYEYGLTEVEFVGFDFSEDGTYFNPTIARSAISDTMGLPYVEELYFGPWSKEIQDKFVFNNFIQGTKVPHEGIVIKYETGERNKIAKVINPDYLIYGEKHDVGDSH